MAFFVHSQQDERGPRGAFERSEQVSRTLGRLLIGVVLLGAGAEAQAGGFDIRLGAYWPRADSTLFDDINSLYTRGAPFGPDTPPGVLKEDWEGFYGGIEYNQKIADYAELAVSIDGYSKGLDTSYRDYVRENDAPIQQRLKLSVIPIGLSLRLGPTSRRTRIAPFVVVGVDAMVYRYEEYGDFVDFFDPDNPIIADSFLDESVAFGWHAGGGIRVGVGDDFAIVGEARYFWSRKDMGQDFTGSRIDLGGLAVTGGFHIRF
jgi:hypothetical protein